MTKENINITMYEKKSKLHKIIIDLMITRINPYFSC